MEQNRGFIRITLAIVMIASFITPFMSNAIILAIPSIGIEFGGNQFWLNWIVFSYLLTSTVFLLPFGRLADLFGRKKIFLIGMVLFALASLACALATSLPALVCFRVFQGLASAMIFGTSMAILTSVVPPQSRGKAIGLNTAAVYIGLSAGPVLGGLLCRLISWRGIFYFNLLLALIVIGLTVWKLRGEWTGSAAKFDVRGSILYIAGLTLLLYGLADLTSGYVYVLSFLCGVMILVLFVRCELRALFPLLPMTMFSRNRSFAFSNLAALVNYSATFALTYVLSLYLQTVQGMDTAVSGLVLLAQPVIMALLSPLVGALSDRIEPRLIASLGMAVTALGLFFFIFLSKQTAIVLIVLNLAFIGFGFALFSSPNTNAVMSSAEQKFYGLASSTLGTMRMLGQSISITIVALVTSVYMRSMTINSSGYAANLMVSIKVLFGIFTVLCLAGVFSSLARGNARQKSKD